MNAESGEDQQRACQKAALRASRSRGERRVWVIGFQTLAGRDRFTPKIATEHPLSVVGEWSTLLKNVGAYADNQTAEPPRASDREEMLLLPNRQLQTIQSHLHSSSATGRLRATRFRRLFHRQMSLALATVIGLTAVHFLLAAGGLGWLATNIIFVGGLATAAATLAWSIRSVSRETEASFRSLQSSYLSSVQALSSALDARDRYTGEHVEEVTELVEMTGRALGLTDPELEALRYAALFHDIGKIGVPDAILNKPGPLTAKEWTVMRRHPVIGEQILAPLEFMAPALPIVRHEHERWDGRGYPDGLAADGIPLGARIILVCDAFHAMVSDRPYRPALPSGEAIARLRAGAGSQFDPHVVGVFLSELEQHSEPTELSAAVD